MKNDTYGGHRRERGLKTDELEEKKRERERKMINRVHI